MRACGKMSGAKKKKKKFTDFCSFCYVRTCVDKFAEGDSLDKVRWCSPPAHEYRKYFSNRICVLSDDVTSQSGEDALTFLRHMNCGSLS
jgi:hypothetical protein